MTYEIIGSGYKDRLEDIIKLGQAGRSIELQVRVYRNLVKQISQSEASDDIPVETDICLFMADFIPSPSIPGVPAKVTKVYALASINESEIDDKTIRHTSNERLKMDYARLKKANVIFPERYF